MIEPGDLYAKDARTINFYAISSAEELSSDEFEIMRNINETTIARWCSRKPTREETYTHFCEVYLTSSELYSKHDDCVCLNENDFKIARKFPNYEKEDESLSRRCRRRNVQTR